MRLIRKLNNNAAVALDAMGREVVVLGRGVGFAPVPSELTDLSAITRTFYDVNPKYISTVSELPQDVILASADIVERAEIKLGVELNPNLPFSLADHISFAILRDSKGVQMAMPLAYDVKHLYPKEAELGVIALEIIRMRTGTRLPDSEAISIALHIVNAEMEGSDLGSMMVAMEIIEKINGIVESQLGIHMDRESYNYSRFAMHLQFLIQRLNAGHPVEDNSGEMLRDMMHEYPKIYACAIAVSSYLEREHHWRCSKDEILYLMLHINRVSARDN